MWKRIYQLLLIVLFAFSGQAMGFSIGGIFGQSPYMKGTTLGLGTRTVPHGGVGTAVLALEGAPASLQFTVAADDYPTLAIHSSSHDNTHIVLDAYAASGTWTSADAGSNYMIHKNSDVFSIEYDSGIAAGSAITWDVGLAMDVNGSVRMGSTTIPTTSSTYDHFFVGKAAAMGGLTTANQFSIQNNLYFNSGWKAIVDGVGSRMSFGGNAFSYWVDDTSNTADSSATLTEILSVDSSSLEYSGRFNQTKSCGTGYDRLFVSYCHEKTFNATSLVRDVCTAVSAPNADAVAVAVDVAAFAKSNNAVGGRSSAVNVYSDSGCTSALHTSSLADAYAYEHTAVAAGTILGGERNNRIVHLPSNGATIYFKFTDDAGNQGSATVGYAGYYD